MGNSRNHPNNTCGEGAAMKHETELQIFDQAFTAFISDAAKWLKKLAL